MIFLVDGRFPAPPQAKKLETELSKLGIRLKIVDIDAGGDIDQEASKAFDIDIGIP